MLEHGSVTSEKVKNGDIAMTQQLNDSTDLSARITIDPELCHGKPCIRGLRYPVETILELLSAGMTHEDILADYDDLEEQDILAALDFAARLTKSRDA